MKSPTIYSVPVAQLWDSLPKYYEYRSLLSELAIFMEDQGYSWTTVKRLIKAGQLGPTLRWDGEMEALDRELKVIAASLKKTPTKRGKPRANPQGCHMTANGQTIRCASSKREATAAAADYAQRHGECILAILQDYTPDKGYHGDVTYAWPWPSCHFIVGTFKGKRKYMIGYQVYNQ